jgi:hypothetical protein
VVALLAEFALPDQSMDAPRDARRRLCLLAGARGVDGDLLATVMNLSQTGMLIDAHVALSVGEPLDIELPEAGIVTAHVVWTLGMLSGCEFRQALPRAAVSAAQLLAPPSLPAGPQVSIVEANLDQRIQRARRVHGLAAMGAFIAVVFAVLVMLAGALTSV